MTQTYDGHGRNGQAFTIPTQTNPSDNADALPVIDGEVLSVSTETVHESTDSTVHGAVHDSVHEPVHEDGDGERVRVLVDPAEVRTDKAFTSRMVAALQAKREPVIAPWLRSKQEFMALVRWYAGHVGHTAAFHTVRCPLYAAKLAARSPVGAVRVLRRTVRWATDAEAKTLRKSAIDRGDDDAYLKLAAQRDKDVAGRKTLAMLGAVVVAAGVLVIVGFAPWWAQCLAVIAAIGVLGPIGGRADKPVVSTRAVERSQTPKLTSDIVIRALNALQISPISQAVARGELDRAFTSPITRDGPGWRAELDLPYGVTATDVMDRRDKLASGLRRPLGCVWPEPVTDVHTGRLVLWVGDQDMSKATQPKWPLRNTGTVDLFKPAPFGTDQRGRWANLTMMFTSTAIGSIPRMGKTFALRELLLIAALDPRAELHAYDLKGTGDLSPLAPVAHAYGVGDDPEDIEAALADLRALRQEMRRRAKVIRNLPRDLCPENKVTPELASRKDVRLHPIVLAVDECQIWFEHGDYGKEFEEIVTDLVKRGPALGIVTMLATQRPDAKSLPTGINANVSTRFCLKVRDHTSNDMVLGTSAHRNGIRATQLSWNDKGMGYLVGEGEDAKIVRTVYIDAPAAEKIAARARAAREAAGNITGHAAGETPAVPTGPAVSLLEDIAAVFAADEDKLWSERVVDRLAKLRPEVYGTWATQEATAKATQLAAALKPFGVDTAQVYGIKDDGKRGNRRGIERDHVTAALNTYRSAGTVNGE